jgi:hypothetical protein
MSKKRPTPEVENGVVSVTTTEATEVRYREYVNRYRSFAKASAEHFIGLAETVVQAERELPPAEFERFCDEVRLGKNGSTHRKLKKIGQNASRFRVVLDQLPNNWTTVYELSKLPNEQFDRVVSSGALTPQMTAKELKQIATGKSKAGRKKPTMNRDLVLDLRGLDSEAQVAVYRKVVDLSDEFGFLVAPSRELASLIEESSGSKPAVNWLPQSEASHAQA